MLEWNSYDRKSPPKEKSYLVRDEDNNLNVMHFNGQSFELQISTMLPPTCTNGSAHQEDDYEVWTFGECEIAFPIVEWCEIPC